VAQKRFAAGAAIYEYGVMSWTAPGVSRIDEPFTGPEREGGGPGIARR
jgi:hypothetical protein